MVEKLVNFRTDEDEYNELKLLALKERTTVKSLLTNLVSNYIKEHKDGNPQFKIDQFQDPDFIACPAFFRNPSYWDNYLKKADNKEKEKIKNQVIMIDKKLGMYL